MSVGCRSGKEDAIMVVREILRCMSLVCGPLHDAYYQDAKRLVPVLVCWLKDAGYHAIAMPCVAHFMNAAASRMIQRLERLPREEEEAAFQMAGGDIHCTAGQDGEAHYIVLVFTQDRILACDPSACHFPVENGDVQNWFTEIDGSVLDANGVIVLSWDNSSVIYHQFASDQLVISDAWRRQIAYVKQNWPRVKKEMIETTGLDYFAKHGTWRMTNARTEPA